MQQYPFGIYSNESKTGVSKKSKSDEDGLVSPSIECNWPAHSRVVFDLELSRRTTNRHCPHRQDVAALSSVHQRTARERLHWYIRNRREQRESRGDDAVIQSLLTRAVHTHSFTFVEIDRSVLMTVSLNLIKINSFVLHGTVDQTCRTGRIRREYIVLMQHWQRGTRR
jgi:hypothetical protein